MKSLVKALNEVCKRYPLQEKIVIVDSHFIGEQINEAYVSEGYHSINLKYKTTYDLASEMVDLFSEMSSHILDTTVASQLMYSLLDNLKGNNQLHYFGGMEITPSFSGEILSTIKKLRLAGYTKDNLPFEAFLTKEKAEDFRNILTSFEKILKERQLFDEADLLTKAIQHVQQQKDVVFVLQSNLQLTFLEEEFLNKLLSSTIYKLPLEQVNGIIHPEKSSLRSISWGETTPLSFIYDIENASEQPNLSFFTAKTKELEVKSVIERVKKSGSILDTNVIYYTNADSYLTHFFHITQSTDIPATFGDGLPISFSRPGRLVSGLIKWIQTDYSVQPFLELLQENLLELGEEAPSKAKIANYLRDLQIGWSKERYLSKLKKEISELENVLGSIENEDKKSYLEKRLKDLNWLITWFSKIFKRLPKFDSSMSYQECLQGISYVLKNHCKTNSPLHEIGKTSLLETLDKVIPFAEEFLSSYEVYEKVKDLLLSLRINKSKPKPGHLHISTYRNGVYNSRPNVYIVGLDNRNFPGGTGEDPLLLDRERVQLGRNIPVLQNSGQDNLYVMLQLLAQSTGRVTISYSNFDINDNRVVSPAHIFLQCYRYATGNEDADFKELKTLPAPLIPSDILEDRDYWDTLLFEETPKEFESALMSHFKNMEYGLESEENRHASEFTEFDGLVQIDANLYDPRINKDQKVSAAKMESLAKCPYSFFLQDVLRVRPIEDIQYDPYRWLDAATRGNLLHSIFETFYKEIGEEKPSFDKHEDKIFTIAKELVEQQRETLPPPNERIFYKEVDDILECCRIFLKEEEAHCESYKPQYFEYTFGLGNYEPAVITLPSGATIHVSGKIDRVDESSAGHYHIIDYKTGSTYGYGTKQIFKGGRQLQHMIYALAIEQHLGLESGKVQESAYYFPTVKGLAERVVRKQDDTVRTNGADILERLIDVLKTGTFTMTDDENDCKFCDFKSVCRRNFYNKEVLETKQMDNSKEELRRFKGVRAYD